MTGPWTTKPSIIFCKTALSLMFTEEGRLLQAEFVGAKKVISLVALLRSEVKPAVAIFWDVCESSGIPRTVFTMVSMHNGCACSGLGAGAGGGDTGGDSGGEGGGEAGGGDGGGTLGEGGGGETVAATAAVAGLGGVGVIKNGF